MRRVAVAAALAVAALSGCGGSGGAADPPEGRELYGAYRAAEDRRDDAEGRLRVAFADIAAAAEQGDREGVLAAAERGRDAAADTQELLEEELDAARRLQEIDALERDARRLESGLETTAAGLALFVQELEIAARDPFLEEEENRREVRRLARRGGQLSADGESDVRRADRALAEALGIEPRPDRDLDAPTTTQSP